MVQVNNAVFCLFLAAAACQDLKRKSIQAWVYILFGSLAAALFFFRVFEMAGTGRPGGGIGRLGEYVGSVLLGTAVGGLLLAAGRLLKGAIGEGDGWFFVVSGVYLGVKGNLELLCYGLIFCCLYCLAVLFKGAVEGKDMRKTKVPFLPFLIPACLWMVMI